MSNLIFPKLAGLTWNNQNTPEFSTRIQKSSTGREVRLALYSTPIVNFELSYEFLRGGNLNNEFQTLKSFYMAMAGSFDTFFYQDPEDCQGATASTLQPIGLADGKTTSFQLFRNFGSFTEPVCFVSSYGGSAPANTGITGLALPAVYQNNILVSPNNYSINSLGVVTFTTPPPSGAVLQWSGTWYYRCRFTDDMMDFTEFMLYFWEAKKVAFRGSLSGKI